MLSSGQGYDNILLLLVELARTLMLWRVNFGEKKLFFNIRFKYRNSIYTSKNAHTFVTGCTIGCVVN